MLLGIGINELAEIFGIFESPQATRQVGSGRLGIRPHPNERREPGHAAIGEFLVAEGDDAADRRRVLPLGVGEAGADREGQAVGQFHDHRAQPAGVAAPAGQVLDHAAFGIVEAS